MKHSTQTQPKKLAIKKSTVRDLTREQLQSVEGGGFKRPDRPSENGCCGACF